MSDGHREGDDRGSGPPLTRIERGVGAPPTRLESGSQTQLDGSRVTTTRVNLPPALAVRFEALGDIGRRGAEADLLLVEEREAGERRVVKLYRQSIRRVDAEMLARVRHADRAHVVEVIDSGEEEGLAWEVLEYCELGSLEDLLEGDAERLQDLAARALVAEAILDEVAAALEHIHGLGFAHRDVKPANILVRSLEPLDLVLADFGLATVMEASQVFGTASRTPGYAAPEAAAGGLYRTSDWWSLGVILVEVLAGRHPLALPDGTMPQPAQLDAEVATRGVDVSGIQDGRWHHLCRGLLTRDPEHRWGTEQVATWRRGEAPPIWQEETASPTALRRRRVSPFPFRDPETGREREFVDPVELANALASDWDAAAEIVEGRDRRQLRTLRDFLESCDFEHAERLLASDDPPETILVRLLVGLDPNIEPTFRGVSLSREGFRRLASEALTSESRADALTAIYEGRVLRLYAAEEGERADFASLDTAWHRNASALEAYLGRFASQLPAGAAQLLPVARARILLAQLDQEHREALSAEAQEARNDSEARQQPWFREFAEAEFAEGDIAHLVVLVLLCEEAARDTRAQAESERQVALRRQSERSSAQRRVLLRLARFAGEGSAAGLVAWLPWVGAADLFNWQGISLRAFMLCVVVGAIYRVGSTRPAWIDDWRLWRGSISAPVGATPLGPVPDLPVARFVGISLMVLAVAGVGKGCGALIESAERADRERHPGRDSGEPPAIGRDLDPGLSAQLAEVFGSYAFARAERRSFHVRPESSGSVRRRDRGRATLVVDAEAGYAKEGDDSTSAAGQFRLRARFRLRGSRWGVVSVSPSFREVLSKLRECDLNDDTDFCDFR